MVDGCSGWDRRDDGYFYGELEAGIFCVMSVLGAVRFLSFVKQGRGNGSVGRLVSCESVAQASVVRLVFILKPTEHRHLHPLSSFIPFPSLHLPSTLPLISPPSTPQEPTHTPHSQPPSPSPTD